MKRLTTLACLAIALVFAVSAFGADRHISRDDATHYSYNQDGAKASGDTIDLMGPGGSFPYRGDFENGNARPSSAGLPSSAGWSSEDVTSPPNHWHVDAAYPGVPLGSGLCAWAGDIGFPACTAPDAVGGYGNDWYDTLEFRKTVTNTAIGTTVRVQAALHTNSETGWDYTYIVRRTAADPYFEAVTAAQRWAGLVDVMVDFTFNYLPTEYLNNQIVVAFLFTSDGNTSDQDCRLSPRYADAPGGASVDDITVTCSGGLVGTYVEDFEDSSLGPDWVAVSADAVGDFTRIWALMGDVDDCASNYSKVVAFVDDGLVVPGSGPIIGGPGYDYGPPGGFVVNYLGGLLGPDSHLHNRLLGPVMTWPSTTKFGARLDFDVYVHELLIAGDSPGVFYMWGLRSAPTGLPIGLAGFLTDNTVYYGGPAWVRRQINVGGSLCANPVVAQIGLDAYEMGYIWGYDGTNGTPAPYFDNVRFKVYPTTGPELAAPVYYDAQDNFPAIGDLDLVNLGNNSIRFDQANNISPSGDLRNDPGDSIFVDVTYRAAATNIAAARLYWTFAKKNPLFDAYRTLPGGTYQPYSYYEPTGGNTYRWYFDLPDTGMLFPGDVLHYYFFGRDSVDGGVTYTVTTLPGNLTGYGNPSPDIYPSWATVHCLPSISAVVAGVPTQPTTLYWNDAVTFGGDDEYGTALRSLGLVAGTDYDIYNTKAPSSALGNGLGGRATVSQIQYYTDMLYNAANLSSPTLSNGDYENDPGDDIGLLNAWLALGGRDLFMTGDDLAYSLANEGTNAQTFLETKMGVTLVDNDVRDNIGGQTAPKVVAVPSTGNAVFQTALSWIAYGGCAGINDFDAVTARAGATRLAQFTNATGATPWTFAAAVLNQDGTNRIVSMNHGLNFVWNQHKAAAPLAVRTRLLSDVLNYFGVANNPLNSVDVPAGRNFAVSSYPNPFNPQLTLKYTLKNPGNVVMKVYNVRGELVKTLLNGQVAETAGTVVWDGTNDQGGSVSSGVYFVETRSGGDVNVQKATMLK